MSTTVDVIILILLFLGAFNGFRKGFIKSVVSFVGLIVSIVIAWYLKNPISEFMYTKLPFISFADNLSLYNIVIYELVAFLIILIVLLAVVKLIATATGLVDKVVGLLSSLGIVSKLLGMLFGLFETFVLIFVVMFLMYNFTTLNTVMDSKSLSTQMLEKTPLLSDMIDNEFKSLEEVAKLTDNYKEGTNEYNRELFKILLNYDVIKEETAQSLIDSGKVRFEGAQLVLDGVKKK